MLLAAVSASGQAKPFEPGKPARTMTTDVYSLGIRNNGHVDVVLADGNPVFTDAAPMVWFEGEDQPERLRLGARYTGRQSVRDALGQGHGMLFARSDCVWELRTYPTKPYLAVRLRYVNTKRKPVRVRMLLPWHVGEPDSGAMWLGPGTAKAKLLELRRALEADESALMPLEDDWEALPCVTLLNPNAGRLFMAGALTAEHARTHFFLRRNGSDGEALFDRLRESVL